MNSAVVIGVDDVLSIKDVDCGIRATRLKIKCFPTVSGRWNRLG